MNYVTRALFIVFVLCSWLCFSDAQTSKKVAPAKAQQSGKAVPANASASADGIKLEEADALKLEVTILREANTQEKLATLLEKWKQVPEVEGLIRLQAALDNDVQKQKDELFAKAKVKGDDYELDLQNRKLVKKPKVQGGANGPLPPKAQ